MTTDPDGLALLPLTFLSRWPEPHTELPVSVTSVHHELFDVGVWAYQSHLFHQLVREQWGDEVQHRVKQAQTPLLGNSGAADLGRMLNLIEAAIHHGMPEIERLARSGGDRNSAIDLTVALALMERSAGTARRHEPEIPIPEGHLVDCLSRGRRRLETAIKPLIATLQLAEDGRTAPFTAWAQTAKKQERTRT